MAAPALDINWEIKDFKNTVKQDVIKLSKVNTTKQIIPILFDWTVIALSIYVCETFFSIGLYLIALWTIAGRQHALLAMMHEAAHFRISKNQTINDLIGNYFAAFPILAATEWYRSHHSKHHKYLNTKNDPDWVRKHDHPEWQFPQSKMRLTKVLVKQFFVGGVEWILLMVKVSGLFPIKELKNKKRLLPLFHKAAYYSVIFSVLIYFNLWQDFLIYWFAPLFFIFPLLQRIRSIAEHFGLSYSNDLNQTRDLKANWVIKLLFAPHNINYHLVHHLFAGVPQHNLPELYKILMDHPVYKETSHQNSSYIFPAKNSLIQDLLR